MERPLKERAWTRPGENQLCIYDEVDSVHSFVFAVPHGLFLDLVQQEVGPLVKNSEGQNETVFTLVFRFFRFCSTWYLLESLCEGMSLLDLLAFGGSFELCCSAPAIKLADSA